MATRIYTPKENGDLKLMAEIDEDMNDAEAVGLLLEESPRLKADVFVVMVGEMDDGMVSTVSQQETVKVAWVSSRNGGAVVEEEDAAEDEAPAPRRRRQSTNGRRKSAAKPAAKSTTRRGPGRPPGSKNKGTTRKGGSPFKRNPASDD